MLKGIGVCDRDARQLFCRLPAGRGLEIGTFALTTKFYRDTLGPRRNAE